MYKIYIKIEVENEITYQLASNIWRNRRYVSIQSAIYPTWLQATLWGCWVFSTMLYYRLQYTAFSGLDGLHHKTNRNVADISEDLKNTVKRLNNSTAFWSILNEKTLPDNLKATLINIRNASFKADKMIIKADNMVADLQSVVQDVKNGKGSIGGILKDTLMLQNLSSAVEKIKLVGDNANNLAIELNSLTEGVKQDFNSGKGTVNAVLKDSALVQKLNKSFEHIEQGTHNFNQNMEALKHNFLFKGYFKKLEKQKKKDEAAKIKKAASL